MIDDVTPSRPRQKRIEPLTKPEKAGPSLVEQAKAADPSFQTPDEIAAKDEAIKQVIHDTPPEPQPAGKPGKFGRFKLKWPPTRKQAIIGGVVAIVIAFGLGALWTQTHKRTVIAVKPKAAVKKEAPKPVPIYSTLTGLPITDAAINQKPVTAVMIENSTDARPQSGLDQAGVVFEAIAEGGITRFMALFQDTAPDYLGPVRSVRPYYIEWGLGFDAAIAHVGGSPEALQDMKTWSVKDLDQFANGGYYHRISSRAAPHNVYTSMAELNQIEANKGYGASSYTGFVRKDEKAYKAPVADKTGKLPKDADTRAVANSIDFSTSGPLYNAHYDYDATTNAYKRSEGGAAHMSQHKDGSQVQNTPKVVIALVTQYGIQSDGKHSDYAVTGGGTAYVFQDGTVTVGKWSKAGDREPLKFTDANGADLPLVRGQTWITAVGDANRVTYK